MEHEISTLVLPVLAFVIGGLTWTGFGYFSAWRKHHKDETWKGFDLKALRNDLVLGLVLGVGAVIATILTDGELEALLTAQAFLLAIQGSFGVIAAVDKFLIGGILAR